MNSRPLVLGLLAGALLHSQGYDAASIKRSNPSSDPRRHLEFLPGG